MNVGRTLKFLQCLAIIAGGLVALFEYVTYKRQVQAAELASQSERRAQVRFNAVAEKVKDVGQGVARYRAFLDFAVTNSGNAPLEVSLWILDVLVGTPQLPKATNAIFIEPVGPLPNRWNPTQQRPSRIQWRKVCSQGAVLAGARDKKPVAELMRSTGVEFVTGGAGTGGWRQGETAEIEQDFIVVAPEDAYLGFVASLCLNGCSESRDVSWSSRVVPLFRVPALGGDAGLGRVAR